MDRLVAFARKSNNPIVQGFFNTGISQYPEQLAHNLSLAKNTITENLTEEMVCALIETCKTCAKPLIISDGADGHDEQAGVQLRAAHGNGSNQYVSKGSTVVSKDGLVSGPRLSQNQVDSLQDYQAGSEVNQVLRGGGTMTDDLDQMTEELDSSMGVTLKDAEVYRVIPNGVADKLGPGDVYQDKGFVSTTKQQGALDDIIDKVGFDSSDVKQMTIAVPKGTRAIDMNANLKTAGHNENYFPQQKEVVLGRGYKFRVESKDAHGNLRVRLLR
jgi:hypothetical protein